MANSNVIKTEKCEVLISYRTVVAVHNTEQNVTYVSRELYSSTTSKHINKQTKIWQGTDKPKCLFVDPSELTALAF